VQKKKREKKRERKKEREKDRERARGETVSARQKNYGPDARRRQAGNYWIRAFFPPTGRTIKQHPDGPFRKLSAILFLSTQPNATERKGA